MQHATEGDVVREEGAQESVAAFEASAEARSTGFLTEFWLFLRHNEKWWMLPIIFALVLVGGLIVLGGSAIAPFVYTLF